jgi:hypothetical protein
MTIPNETPERKVIFGPALLAPLKRILVERAFERAFETVLLDRSLALFVKTRSVATARRAERDKKE